MSDVLPPERRTLCLYFRGGAVMRVPVFKGHAEDCVRVWCEWVTRRDYARLPFWGEDGLCGVRFDEVVALCVEPFSDGNEVIDLQKKMVEIQGEFLKLQRQIFALTKRKADEGDEWRSGGETDEP